MSAKKYIMIGLVVVGLFALLGTVHSYAQSSCTLNPSCQVPPVVGVGVRPSALLNIDFGGTLQYPSAFMAADGSVVLDTHNTYYYSSSKVLNATGDGETGTANTPSIPTIGSGTYPYGSNGVYDPLVSFYGIFESDSYYVYDQSNDYFTTAGATQQTPYNFTAPSQQGSDVHHIIFTAAGHNFAPGDVVVPSGLTSNRFLNGNGYKVTNASGDTFEIDISPAFYNGNPDNAVGSVIKRVTGSVDTGLSGNILNFVTASRMDTIIKALIGGKTVPSIDSSSLQFTDCTKDCQLQAQGSRRFMTETTNLNASFYVRPATLSTTSTNYYPNDYNTGTYFLGADGKSLKDIFFSMSGKYASKLPSGSQAALSEKWTFTISRSVNIRATLVATWASGGTQLTLYDQGGTQLTSVSTTGSTVLLSYNLAPGTYSLVVAPKVSSNFTGGNYTVWSNVALQAASGQAQPSTIGAIPWARVRVYVPGTRPTGLVQQNWGGLNLGLIVFREADPNDKTVDTQSGKFMQGRILLAADDDTHYYNKKLAFVNILQGYPSKDIGAGWAAQMYPWGNSKRTTESLSENWSYLQGAQSSMNNANNDHYYWYSHAERDTYRSWDSCSLGAVADSTVSPTGFSQCSCTGGTYVGCQKVFSIIVGDGDGIQAQSSPVQEAYQLHTYTVPNASPNCTTGDIREPPSGCQVVNLYSLLAFSHEPTDPTAWSTAKRYMLGIAMEGGYNCVANCGSCAYAYGTDNNYVSNNVTSQAKAPWWVKACDPTSSSYNATCCAEWDAVWDRTGDGTNSQKGLPDTYFEAQTGKQLSDGLKEILLGVLSKYATASAVATVSQESRSGDAVIRGVFEASDLTGNLSNYLWKGHLEVYLPHTETQYSGQYDFDFSCNVDMLCKDMPGQATSTGPCPPTANCWDAGLILEQQTPVTAVQRNIFTMLYAPDAAHPAPTGNRAADKGVQVNFKFSDLDATAKSFSPSTTVAAILGVTSDTDAQNVINWTRGEMTAILPGYRDRSGWLLADIVYSTPVVVGPPKLGGVSKQDPNIKQYINYMDAQQYRDKVVYVGANDGMLHAFLMSTNPSQTDDGWQLTPTQNPQIGKELWAYIPGNLLTRLPDLASSTYGTPGGCLHRFMVDLSPRVWQVYIKPRPGSTACTSADSQGRCFRTVLIGGERGGGDVYFAIDITDPYNPIVLWEYSVLWNRVVVETQQSLTTVSKCKSQCITDCTAVAASTYTDCVNGCSGSSSCKTNCKTTYNSDLNACSTSCATQCPESGSTSACYVPYRPYYECLKNLSLSWSQPYMGRIQIPTDVSFFVGDPVPNDLSTGGNPSTKVQWNADNNKRTVVFMGGGIHYFDVTLGGDTSIKYKDWLWKPFLLMIDVETGMNLFEYVWPTVYYNYVFTLFTPQMTDATHTVPYLMSDPLCLDVWDMANNGASEDGYIDRLYVGDMNGNFYGIKFNLSPTASKKGVMVELWPTKPITSVTDLGTDIFRSNAQPITSPPVVSYDDKDPDYLRVIFGTGKYDDVVGTYTDKQDTVRMALYNLKDKIAVPTLTSSAKEIYTTNFWVDTQQHCSGLLPVPPSTTSGFNTGCKWAKESGSTVTGDCCESANSSCTNPCYSCIYDLTHPSDLSQAGERITGKPTIAGGVVFVTTFVPPTDKCNYAGNGYLYAFSYTCGKLDNASDLFPDSGATLMPIGTSTDVGGVSLSLGPGMPSRPVLDTKGENIIVQMSDGTIKRVQVQLPKKPVQFKGWRER